MSNFKLTCVSALTLRSSSCPYSYLSIVALFKHDLLIDLNGAHPLCCAVASIRNQEKTTGGKLHQACLSHMILLWWPKVYLVHNQVWEVQNVDLQLQCLWFGRTNASINLGALILKRNFEDQDTKPSSKLAQGSIILQCLCFIYNAIYRCIDWDWLC